MKQTINLHQSLTSDTCDAYTRANNTQSSPCDLCFLPDICDQAEAILSQPRLSTARQILTSLMLLMKTWNGRKKQKVSLFPLAYWSAQLTVGRTFWHLDFWLEAP